MHRDNALRLKKEYECKFGPLSNPKGNMKHWDWIDDPWPWDYQSDVSPCFTCCRREKGACR